MRIKFINISAAILLFLFISTNARAQWKSNRLTPAHFNSITFNDLKFSELKKTKGDELEMQKLRQADRVCEGGKEIGEKWRSFHYNDGLSVYFSGLSKSQKPHITKIEANSITIKNKKVKLGDGINSLGQNIVISNKNDKSVFYSFTSEDSDCCLVSIEVSSNTNNIIKIIYFVQT
ncbi:hypothetical protein [Robertkochia aurantiaca]|uniref:hypothetical protein n=1 Tax=Robertkochia aurantiaca TaxID=2873700 RepID=UPI001CCABA1F|nr:hypothetical protein [Robertkochia sp. 3YJGBD-33]